MNKLLVVLSSIVIAMLNEAMLRKINKVDEADAAEKNAIDAAVVLGLALVEKVKLPVYLLPVKYFVFNEKVLKDLAKFTFDHVEVQINLLTSAIDAEKLQELKQL